MKPSTNSKGLSNSSASNSKPKKSNKDREKRKSQTGNEKNDTTEKGSPSKDGSARKYAGIGPDSILIYSEQSSFEHLSEDLCYGFAEDLSYKLRFIIHDALIKARLSGRNHILSNDIDAAFDNINISRVYGATSTQNWVPFGDQTLYYLDDSIINLVEISEEENNYEQPGDIIVSHLWLPEPKDISNSLKKYYETMCFAIVVNDSEVQMAALKDIRENTFIGPIVEWFYRFSYFLLSKDITYDSLTLSTLDLIRALEDNPVAAQTVSEKLISLLTRLILQRLLRSATTAEVLHSMSQVLKILSNRILIRQTVTVKIWQKLQDLKETFCLPIISIINELGVEAINDIFVPYIDYFLSKVQTTMEPDLIFALLRTYHIIATENIANLHDKFYGVFGDSLVPIWKTRPVLQKIEKPETNLKNIRLQLLKTRRKIPCYNNTVKKWTIEEAFPDIHDDPDYLDDPNYHDVLDYPDDKTKPKISFKFNTNIKPMRIRDRLSNMTPNRIQETVSSKEGNVIIGQRTILISVLKNYKCKTNLFEKCIDHTILQIL